ncbi:MAG: class I SAM-dependent methyltransferase [Gemmatimonadaceae bacterium]
MNPNKALWEKGDFSEIAAFMRQSGAEIARSIGATTPVHILDLGCGDGTTALPLAAAGHQVVGVDIARNLVERGKARAAAAGLDNLTFHEGDACQLDGHADGTYDVTISCFGAMFAPKPFEVAREMVRVTKPGGKIVMGNWIPNDPTSFVSQLLRISSAFTPPPPEGFISPMTWGVESHIVERFGKAGVPSDHIEMTRGTFTFTSRSKSPDDFIDAFRKYYGPTMNAFESAHANGTAEELHKELVALAREHNTTSVGFSIPATFMRVTVAA